MSKARGCSCPVIRFGPLRDLLYEVNLWFGLTLVGTFDRAVVVWSKDGEAGIRFVNTPIDNAVSWATFDEFLRPAVQVIDPFRPDRLLFFRALCFREDQLFCDTSAANRHLFPGLKLTDAQLMLPVHGIIILSLRVWSAKHCDGRLHLNLKIFELDRQAKRLFRLCSLASGNSKKSLDFTSVRRLREILRVEPIATKDDYNEVLHLRLVAYRAANIVPPDARVEQMSDEYDKRAIILVAQFNEWIWERDA